MYLIIDVGNTLVKSAVFDNNKLIERFVFKKSQIISEVKKIVSTYNTGSGIISSVANLPENKINRLHQILNLMELNHQTKIPFINLYKTPQTLGVDRIAVASAGVYQYPKKNILIIDAGTCIKYDFVNKNREYLGGAISPGIRMRYKALHDYTAKLPLLETENLEHFIGNDTNTSLHSGVINGTIKEIEGVISQYQQQFKDLTIVLTGGDTNFLSKQLKSGIFANPNFLLEGLYVIFRYNTND